MNTPKMAIAIGYIDDDLVSAAIEYKPSSIKSFWFHNIVIAACFCFIIIGGIRMARGFMPKSSTNGPMYGVVAEVIEVLEDERYEVKVTGEDHNFAKDEIVIINCDKIMQASEPQTFQIGDIIAITYSSFEKNGTVNEITPGQISIIQTSPEATEIE